MSYPKNKRICLYNDQLKRNTFNTTERFDKFPWTLLWLIELFRICFNYFELDISYFKVLMSLFKL